MSTIFPADQTRINSKYGKWGRVLGRGTGGTVRLIQASTRAGGKTYAVKEFRKKKPKETEFEYQRMISAECCFAANLKHPNIVETIDIIRNKGHYYHVMEYAPYDLFSVVMAGKMTHSEITCVFRQICDGVDYLHTLGLAHRDLKLENCVMTEDGIVKLIDFGTAIRAFSDEGVILATGLVGSDPYVAPELVRGERYDARKSDVWSVGIIFVAMALKRFPWGLADPRTDHNYRRFVQTLPEFPKRKEQKEQQQRVCEPPKRKATELSVESEGSGGSGNTSASGGSGTSSSEFKYPSVFGSNSSYTTFTSVESSLILTPSDTSPGPSYTPFDPAAITAESSPNGDGWDERGGKEGYDDMLHMKDANTTHARLSALIESIGPMSLSTLTISPDSTKPPSIHELSPEFSSAAPTRTSPPSPLTDIRCPTESTRLPASAPVSPNRARESVNPYSSLRLPNPQRAMSEPALTQIFHPDSMLASLPPETRWTIMRMLQVEPSARISLAELIRGTEEDAASQVTAQQQQQRKAKSEEGLRSRSGAGQQGVGSGPNWLRSIVPCSEPDVTPNPPHSHPHARLKAKSSKWSLRIRR